jgi:hypothetical protein
MMRNKALAQLQKTYDESYLSCSKAVYYESQVCLPLALCEVSQLCTATYRPSC